MGRLMGWTDRLLISRSNPGVWNTERNFTLASDREKALDAGCDDYDTKPVELPRLLEKIDKLINGGGG